jgi:GNAT superfamily N-acetyltransferase
VSALEIRHGRSTDGATVLGLWDTAIEWLAQRGQPEQWGTEPASSREWTQRMVAEWVTGDGLRIAELDGVAVGASVITATGMAHIPPTPLAETYLMFLISERGHAGQGIGAALVRRAADEARAAGSEVLRVDCWAGAPPLVAWYEHQGFVRSDAFAVEVRGRPWHGQVFEMPM